MKLAYTIPKLALGVVSILLGVVVLTSVLPLLSGGLTVNETSTGSGLAMNADGVNMNVTGDYTVESSLPYDINDAYLEITMGRSGGPTMKLYERIFDVPSGGSEGIVINERIFLPTVLAMAFVDHNTGKLSVPVTISVGGSYLEKLANIGIEVDMIVNISESTAGFTKNTVPLGDDYASFEVGISANSIEDLSSMIPDEPISAKFGNTTVTFTKTVDSDGKPTLSLEGASVGEGVLNDIRNSTEIVVTSPSEMTISDIEPEQMAELASVLEALLEAE